MRKFFILGNPRSGTSLLRIVLNAHPNITAPPESGFLQWWHEKYIDWPPADAVQFANDIYSSKKFEAWGITPEEIVRLLNTHDPGSYGKACAVIYSYYGHNQGKERLEAIIDKNNYYIHHIETLREIWPDAGFIHLLRDGRDVACSYIDLQQIDTNSPYRPDLPTDIETIAREWADNNHIIATSLRDIPERAICIRYEDLLLDKEKTLSTVLNFIGLDWSDALMDHTRNHDEPSSTLAWKQRTKGAFDPSRIARFKDRLTPQQIETFEAIAGDVLRRYNYM